MHRVDLASAVQLNYDKLPRTLDTGVNDERWEKVFFSS